MSIRKRVSLIILGVVGLTLLFMDIMAYYFFYNGFSTAISDSQQTLISANVKMCNNFTLSIDQVAYQFISDENMGELLSRPTGVDPLVDINTKSTLTSRIFYYLSSQGSLENSGFYNILYLNPAVPVSNLFATQRLPAYGSHTNTVFSAAAVQQEDWYQNALASRRSQYVFVNGETGQICFAKKVQNTYYTGPHQEDGVGVLLTAISPERFGQNLSLTDVTENSIFALLDSDGTMVYTNSAGSAGSAGEDAPLSLAGVPLQRGTSTVSLGGESYLCTVYDLDWGMWLVSLTPNSDVTQAIHQALAPFTLVAVIFMAAFVLSVLTARSISRPVTRLAAAVEGITDPRTADLTVFDSFHTSTELVRLAASFKAMLQRNNALIDDLHAQDEKRRQSELRALQAQINPHFILNAMNAVNWMALARGEDDIASTVASIANLMRYSITEPDSLVPLAEELANVREYIKIYDMRFGQSIRLHTGEEAALAGIIIPKLTLQPLIENSIRHGIDREDPAGIDIFVTVYRTAGETCIEVTDTGRGCDVAELERYLNHQPCGLKVSHGFGIRNVNERLQLCYGPGSRLCYTTNAAGQLCAQLHIVAKNSTPETK